MRIALRTILAILIFVGPTGCSKSTGTPAGITDTSKIVVQLGRGIPKVCEIGMSVEEVRKATGDASTRGRHDRDAWWSLKRLTQERFALVPNLGVIGVPEQNGILSLLTFYVQPYDSTTTVPGLVVTNPFRGSLSTNLSFNNKTVSRKEVEVAFGPVTQDLTNYADFPNLPDKTKPFAFRGKTLHYPRLGLSFDLRNDTVESFTVRTPQRSE